MKTSLTVVLFLLTAGILAAQTNATAPPQTNAVVQVTNIAYAIANRDANSRVWQTTNWTQDASGQSVPHAHKITELGIGLCHKDGNGNYVDSSEAIALLPDGTAAATNCATSVYFPADVASGVIRLVTSESKVLQNGPAYLAYDDGTNTAIIGTVTNSVGQLISSNQVLYPDIFHGAGFRADLQCTVRKSGFESDLVFREQIPDPASLGLGTNARILLLTEWLDTPEPAQTTNAPSQTDGMTDVTLHFGSATIARGKAFITGLTNSNARLKQSDSVPVYKSWIHSASGQAYLVESVPYRRLAPQLRRLPVAAQLVVSAKRVSSKIFALHGLPSRSRVHRSGKAIQLARGDSGSQPGVVLDYVEISGSIGSYTFTPGTYFVSGPTYCANGVIQGGAIFKYPNDTTSFLQIDNITWQTGPYNPAIFTAGDDDSVGESMNGIWPGYTGSLLVGGAYFFGYADPAPLVNVASVKNARVRYATEAVYLSNPGNLAITDSQFVNCLGVLYLDNLDSSSMTLENCLIAGYSGYYGPGTITFVGNSFCNISLYNCTVDSWGQLVSTDNGDNGTASIYSVNSIFSNVGGFGDGSLTGGYNGFLNNPESFGDNPISSSCSPCYYPENWFNIPSGDYDYDFGAGQYYLACPDFRNAGTSDTNDYVLDPSVLVDIATKTTQPPNTAFYSTYSQSATLGVVNPGDTNSAPDLGYHYARLDYVFCENEISTNLTFSPGTAVGWCIEPSDDDWSGMPADTGIWLDSGFSIAFQGNWASPCYFVDCRTVWELPDRNDGGTAIVGSSASGGPNVNATFTRFCTIDGNSTFFGSSGNLISVSGKNCEFWNGEFCQDSTSLTLNLFNCLLDEPGLYFMYPSGAPACSFTLNNCTVEGCNQILIYRDNSAWPINIANCAFDAYLSYGLGGSYSGNISCDYNAYTQGSPRVNMAGTHDVFVSSGFNWQPGPLGNFYLPKDPPAQDGTLLTNAGSTTADRVGLYEYTTQTNAGSIEGISIVDIGYHSLAVDTNGNPVSTLVAGVPDYVSDTNGNGLPDTWEMEYFGNLNQYASELDGAGNTLLYDYTNGLDPNVIFFTLLVTNGYVDQTNAPVQINLHYGVPAYYAVLVNDINQADATWQPYTSSNLTAGLGPTNGLYQVWVGLKGFATNATQTWEETTLTLDTIPPTIAVTSPAPSVVSQPMVQVRGLVSEELSSLTFDVSNAVSLLTNQTGYASESFYDTNLLSFTSNSFQLYDVSLTNGLNTITIHATDRAGNTSTTNFGVTLDYSGDTNPPAINVLWPANGAQVSGGSFTVQATVDDLTAQVTASANGQSVPGQIQRNGYVRGLTLPLVAGTNTVTVTATDAAGNSNTNTLNIVQSSVSLSISPLTSDQLNQSSVSVTGAVSDVTQIITVNGVQATVAGSSNWIATNVPVNAIGMATFTVEAYPSGSDPATADPDGGLQAFQPQPPAIRINSYEQNDLEWNNSVLSYDTYNWMNGVGGDEIDIFNSLGGPGTHVLSTNWPGLSEEPLSFTPIKQPLSGITYNSDPKFWTFDDWSDENGIYDGSSEVNRFFEVPKLVLDNGGEGAPGTTQSYLLYFAINGFTNGTNGAVRPEDFTMQGRSLVDTGTTDEFGDHWGVVPVSYPAGAPPPLNLTTKSPGVSAVPLSYGANNDGTGQSYVVAAKAQPITILANGMDLSTTNPEFCVGQPIIFTVATNLNDGSVIATNFQWTLDGEFVNEFSRPCTTCSINYTNDPALLKLPILTNVWWVSGEFNPTNYNVLVTCTLMPTNGNPSFQVSTSGRLKMHRPYLTNYIITATNPLVYIGITHQHFYGTTPNDLLGVYPLEFTYDVSVVSAFDGFVEITQLLNGVMTNMTSQLLVSQGSNWLDNTETYIQHSVAINNPTFSTVNFDDSPHSGCAGFTDFDIVFTDYVRFIPDPAGSIPITLGTITWSGTVTSNISTNGGIADYTPAMTNTTGSSESDHSGTLHLPAGIAPSDVFPQWDQIAHNVP